MLYGRWEDYQQNVSVSDNELKYIEASISPIQSDEKHSFAIVDSLSNMVSRQYIMLTSPEGKIKSLIPQKQPNEMGVLIPSNNKGKVLRLWRFKLKPNYDDVKKMLHE